jgi:hypothetical protein
MLPGDAGGSVVQVYAGNLPCKLVVVQVGRTVYTACNGVFRWCMRRRTLANDTVRCHVS